MSSQTGDWISGWARAVESHEYRKFGIDQQQATGRMYEGTEVILQAWSDKPVNFRGEFFTYDNVPVFPKPVAASASKIVGGMRAQ